jgi:hypothetical protein
MKRLTFVDENPRSKHVLRGTTVVDRIQFTNGWVIAVSGDHVAIVDPTGLARPLRF